MAVEEHATYELKLFGPPVPEGASWRGPVAIDAVGLSVEFRREMEENVSEILPDGWYVQIRPAS